MQNEELQHVFKLSEHQNERHNGFLFPTPADRTPAKSKRHSPKKKNADMVTATSKPVIKRRPKTKNSNTKAENVILNGVNAVNNVFPKNKELHFEKYRTLKLNHLDNVKSEESSFDPINSTIPNFNKTLDSNLLTTIKYADVLDHTRTSEVASNVNYSRNQYATSDTEFDIKPNNIKASNQKSNNLSTVARLRKLEELKLKSDEYTTYLAPDSSSLHRASTNNAQYESFVDRIEAKFGDSRKLAEKEPEKSLPALAPSKSCESKLFLKAKRRRQRKSKWQMDSGTRHEALQRIRECIDLQENLQNDLFPLSLGETGYEKSDSDSSEDYSNTFQNYWFHSMSEIEFDEVKRNLRLSQLYSELRRQLYQIKQNKSQLPTMSEKFMKSLVNVARAQPLDIARVSEEPGNQKLTMIEPLILSKKKCALEACKNVALPCMPTCVRHVLLCDKQMLFEQCRVRDSNSFQCDKPVVNIKYHYPVCSLHSKPDFVLPDFARDEVKYEEVRRKNVSTISAETYKTDTDFLSLCTSPVSCPPVSSKVEATTKKHLNSNSSNFTGKHQASVRSQVSSDKKEKDKKPVDRKENKAVKKEPTKPKVSVTPRKLKEANRKVAVKEEIRPPIVPEVNHNLLRDWVSLSDGQLVDAKTLENTLQSDFVNGFDINSSSIQSQIQDIINSETSLSTDILMGSNELPNYIQVEEMIEEVEITDETLDSTELGNQELVHSEDLNAVLKQLPPEAFNELFSEFTLSEG